MLQPCKGCSPSRKLKPSISEVPAICLRQIAGFHNLDMADSIGLSIGSTIDPNFVASLFQSSPERIHTVSEDTNAISLTGTYRLLYLNGFCVYYLSGTPKIGAITNINTYLIVPTSSTSNYRITPQMILHVSSTQVSIDRPDSSGDVSSISGIIIELV